MIDLREEFSKDKNVFVQFWIKNFFDMPDYAFRCMKEYYENENKIGFGKRFILPTANFSYIVTNPEDHNIDKICVEFDNKPTMIYLIPETLNFFNNRYIALTLNSFKDRTPINFPIIRKGSMPTNSIHPDTRLYLVGFHNPGLVALSSLKKNF